MFQARSPSRRFDVDLRSARLLAVLCLAACGSSSELEVPLRRAGRDAEVPQFRCGENSMIDVVLVVDTSLTFEDDRERSAITASEVLRSLAACGRLRLGVLTSDLGAGAHAVFGCTSIGDDARLLPLEPGMAAYIEGEPDELSSAIRNAIVARPVGCGFEQPLQAARRFLLSPQSEDFDRPGAPNILSMSPRRTIARRSIPTRSSTRPGRSGRSGAMNCATSQTKAPSWMCASWPRVS